MGHPPQAWYSLQIAAVSPQWGHQGGPQAHTYDQPGFPEGRPPRAGPAASCLRGRRWALCPRLDGTGRPGLGQERGTKPVPSAPAGWQVAENRYVGLVGGKAGHPVRMVPGSLWVSGCTPCPLLLQAVPVRPAPQVPAQAGQAIRAPPFPQISLVPKKRARHKPRAPEVRTAQVIVAQEAELQEESSPVPGLGAPSLCTEGI